MGTHSLALAPRARALATVFGLALAYALAGRLALLLPFASPHPPLTAWTPSGMALAGVLIYGPGAWPGIWLGAFCLQVWTAGSPAFGLSIYESLSLHSVTATGATLQSLAGAWLVRRFAWLPAPPSNESDTIRLLILGGPVSCLIGPAFGTIGLLGAGIIPWANVPSRWWTGFVGDTIGVLTLAPLILLWAAKRAQRSATQVQIDAPWQSEGEPATVNASLEHGLARRTAQLSQANASLQRKLDEGAHTDALLRLTVETALDAVITMDDSGRITSWNPQAERLFGWAACEAIGKPLASTIIPPRYREAHRQGLLRFLKTGETTLLNQRVEISALRRDGSEFPVELTVAPAISVGRCTFVGFIRDITDRKRAERELRDSEARFRAFMNHSAILAFMKDEDGRYVYINESTERMFGMTLADLRGKTDFDFLPERVARQLRANDLAVITSGKGLELEEVVPTPDGKTRFWLSLKFPFTDSPGRRMVGGVAVEITGRKEAEQRLERANAELQEKNVEMEQLVYTVSHDLKSPLVTIQGYAGRVKTDAGSGKLERVMRSCERMDYAVTRMRQLIDGLLAFGTFGRQTAPPELVDTGALVQGLAAAHAVEIAGDGVLLTIQPDMPAVKLDKGRLTQVFDNLLVNAWIHRGETRPLHVTVGCERTHDELRFFVRDNGPGIPPEYREQVFELFWRLDQHSTGTGLGLSIVRRSVESMGGRVWVESTPGHGATFQVAFPSTVAALSPAAALTY